MAQPLITVKRGPGRPRNVDKTATAAAAQSAVDLAESLLDLSQQETEPEPELVSREDPGVALFSVLSQLGDDSDGVEVHVFRYGGTSKGNRDIWCESYTPEEFARGGMKLLRDVHGGGEFRIKVIGANAKFIANKLIDVEKRVIPPVDPAAVARASIDDLGKAMLAGLQGLGELIVRQQQAAPAPVNPMTQLTEVIAAIGPLLKQSAPVAAAPAADPFDMLLKLMTIKEKLGDGGGGDRDGTTEIILEGMRSFAKPVVDMMAAQALQKGGSHVDASTLASQAADGGQVLALNPPMAAPGQAATVGTAAPVAPQVEESELSLKIAILKPTILMMAAGDADPYPYASMVLDTFGDDEVQKYITAPDWQTQLEKLIPEAAQYRPWFAKLHAQVLELLKDDGVASA